MKRSKTQTIKEVASLLKSIYSIVLIIGIMVSAVVQVYPYLFQPLAVEIVKVVTPILVAVLISYIFVRMMRMSIQNEIGSVYDSIYGKLERLGKFQFVTSQIQTLLLGNIIRSSGKLENLKLVVQRIKQLDELWNDPEAAPLYGVRPENFVVNVIETAKWWNIPFEELCNFLVRELGKERVKRLVDSSEILNIYGKDCLATWNDVMK